MKHDDKKDKHGTKNDNKPEQITRIWRKTVTEHNKNDVNKSVKSQATDEDRNEKYYEVKGPKTKTETS